jgi:hypothetical protein
MVSILPYFMSEAHFHMMMKAINGKSSVGTYASMNCALLRMGGLYHRRSRVYTHNPIHDDVYYVHTL